MFSHRFFVLKKRYIILVVCLLLVAGSVVVYFTAIKPTFHPNTQKVIVIDAGHGGKDGGAVGKTTEVTESFLNLQYAIALQKICTEYGFKTILTRQDMGGLYSPFAKNKKRSEMEKRESIIKKNNPDVVVSIHMNSFPSSSTRGAQVFFAEGSQSGQTLADSVQKCLHQNLQHAKSTAKVGDYYILNCTQSPSILVECGFLSNPEEEVLLQNEEYINKLCYQIVCGILMYFEF